MENLILLHGALGDKSQFKALSESLGKSFSIHTFDFYGHGVAEFRNDFSIEAFSKQLLNYIHEHELEKPLVFGYSMGGYVALNTCALDSGRITKIATLGTKFSWTPQTAEQEVKQLNPRAIKEKVPAFATDLERRHGNKWEQLLEKTAEMMIALGKNPVLTLEKLGEVAIPVRIGLGDRDKMVSIEESMNAYRSLKNGSFYMLSETKHPLETVDTNQLAFQIRSFMLGR